MRRYFFHVHDGVDYRDSEGLTFETLDEARAQAVRAAVESLRDASLDFTMGEVWTMEVQDEYGITVFELTFSAK